MTVVLALDVGEKKIGAAVGDTDTRLAFTRPALLVASWDELWPSLHRIIMTNSIQQIVVGWPLSTDGSTNLQTERVREFIHELRNREPNIDIVTRDERLTSQAVQREQQAAGRTLRRGEEDSLAAQLLLEGYLQEHA